MNEGSKVRTLVVLLLLACGGSAQLPWVHLSAAIEVSCGDCAPYEGRGQQLRYLVPDGGGLAAVDVCDQPPLGVAVLDTTVSLADGSSWTVVSEGPFGQDKMDIWRTFGNGVLYSVSIDGGITPYTSPEITLENGLVVARYVGLDDAGVVERHHMIETGTREIGWRTAPFGCSSGPVW
jgi:hypothetical protein